MKLLLDDRLVAPDPVALALAGIPMYFGDLPADGRPRGFVGEIRNVKVSGWWEGAG